MQNPSQSEVRAAARRLATKRRAKRGLVAGYIHELSARHAADATSRERPRPAAVLARTRAEQEATAGV
jgi:hypothetical protein